MNEEGRAKVPAWRRIANAAGNTWIGIALMGAMVLYLALASGLSEALGTLLHAGASGAPPAAGERLASLLGTAPEALYRHWILAAPAILFCVNLAVATIFRVPARIASIGAWCSHAGIFILALGAACYAVRSVRGDCVTSRTQQGWTPVESFYLERSGAIYLGEKMDEEPRCTEICTLQERKKPVKLNVSIPAGGGAEVRATELLPNARLGYEWRDTSPNPFPAVILRITDRDNTRETVLAPELEEAAMFSGDGYVIVHRPNTDARTLDKLSTTGGPQMAHDLALILTGPEIQPTIVVVRPDAQSWTLAIQPGRSMEVPLAGRRVRIEVLHFLTHAARIMVDQAPKDAPEKTGMSAVRVKITAGEWSQETLLPFTSYEHLGSRQLVELPGGQRVLLSFSRTRVALPASIHVDSAEYQTYPGSVVPKDYVCRVRVVSGGQKRRETISLNHPVPVGPYQISQNSWLPNADHPTDIVFSVASRPALGVIWLGCTMICLGLPIAFYLKPLLLRAGRART